MPEWLIEEGIAETRAVLIDKGEVRAAKLLWPSEITAGHTSNAQLVSKSAGARRGLAQLENGTEVLVDHLPAHLTEGAQFRLVITRAQIAERGRLKRATGRYIENDQDVSAPAPFTGTTVRSFDAGMWEDVWHAASSGTVDFAGGQILCSATPAMTLIDIDGKDSPQRTAISAVPAIAQALQWFDIGGSIGIDFPTLEAKTQRREVDTALAQALARWPHERTAMNGFGFVQIVARLEGPSLLHRFATSRTGLCARFALRVAERSCGAGPVLLLTIHPALKAKLKPQWIEELARRTGKQVRIETDPTLALEAPHAQILSA